MAAAGAHNPKPEVLKDAYKFSPLEAAKASHTEIC
jgi:hypothetical protein